MAKSLRSKWRRKCRAVKRIRYGEKELARLKQTLGIDDNAAANKDIDMSEIQEIATVTNAEAIKESIIKKEEVEKKAEKEGDDEVEPMDDGTVQAPAKKFSKKTLKNEHGNYPIWMNPRHIAKHKKGRAKNKKAISKKDKRLTRKDKKKLKNKNKSKKEE
ncbi:hypothetical protein TKK_0003398 [Trichogramma kaykai]|uniref:Protein LLP homolog n=1 Tax=Trichogramma kaykai TaxID=54128 RepID=A0ABD2XQ20_9HYME